MSKKREWKHIMVIGARGRNSTAPDTLIWWLNKNGILPGEWQIVSETAADPLNGVPQIFDIVAFTEDDTDEVKWTDVK